MFELFNNGKVVVTQNQITIKGMMSSTTYNRREIRNITFYTGIGRVMGVIINTIMFWGIFRAFKMIFNVRVHLNLYNGKYHSFYVSNSEYKELRKFL